MRNEGEARAYRVSPATLLSPVLGLGSEGVVPDEVRGAVLGAEAVGGGEDCVLELGIVGPGGILRESREDAQGADEER